MSTLRELEAETADARPGLTLRRKLGLLDATGIGFGAIVGAGIFVVTGVAAGVAGPAFLAGLLVAGAAASFRILVYYGIANLSLALSLSLPTIVTGLGVLAVGIVLRLLVRRVHG